jgi:hypothetical protein
MAKVPDARLLGLGFAAFWTQQHDSQPPGTVVSRDRGRW